jgi:hypothetical protein
MATIKLCLYLIKRYAMKTHVGIEVYCQSISVLDGGETSASRPSCLTPGERASDTVWIRGWAGLRASLDNVEKEKISCPFWKSNTVSPDRIARSLYTILLSDSGCIQYVNQHFLQDYGFERNFDLIWVVKR